MKMKQLIALLLALAMSMSLVACGGGTDTSTSGTSDAGTSVSTSAQISGESEGTIEVDKGLLNVSVTIPASMLAGMTEEDIKEMADEGGLGNYTMNTDGSVTYTMSKSEHEQVLKQFKESLKESVDDLLNGEEAVESFQKIEYNDDISEVNVYVDQAKFNGMEMFYSLSFYIVGMYYQLFAGVEPDNIDIVVNYIDASTNETIDSMSFRDLMEASEQADSSAAAPSTAG